MNKPSFNIKDSKNILIVLSFFAIYVIWGSTYLAISFVVEEIPPFLMAGSRYILAGLIIFLLVFIFGKKRKIQKRQLYNSVIAGILFLTIGSGGVNWALQFVDSGFTALLISAQPLVLIIMMWGINRKPLPFKSFAGVFLGMLGIYLLVSQDALVSRPGQWIGIAVIFLCLLAWGYGSIFVSKAFLPESPLYSSGIQMFCGGIVLLMGSAFLEDWDVRWTEVSNVAWISLCFLVIFGSIIAFSAFNFLLKNVSPEKVSTNTYVNPVVALFLGYYFRNEVVTIQSIIASGILLTGVYFINSSSRKLSVERSAVPKMRKLGNRLRL